MSDSPQNEDAHQLRRRIRAHALFHKRGQELDVAAVLRFRRAGTWQESIDLNLPEWFVDVLTDSTHDRRVPMPSGPILAYRDGDERMVVNVAEQLLSSNRAVREASLNYFNEASTAGRPWMTSSLVRALNDKLAAILSTSEQIWVPSSLELFDLFELDFGVNLTGAAQASHINCQEMYTEYMSRVLRPKMASFQHEGPPIVDPAHELDTTRRAAVTRIGECHSLEDVLDYYLHNFGYMPLGAQLSAGWFLSKWFETHPAATPWGDIWNWAESKQSALALYHACSLFLEHPEWIPPEMMQTLLDRVREIISTAFQGDDQRVQVVWDLRADLQRHYAYQVQAFAVGLNGAAAAAYACWIADMLAKKIGMNAEHIDNARISVIQRELDISARRWAFARSRTSPSPLRNAVLWSRSIWGDSLLVTACRNWLKLKTRDAPDSFRKFLIDKLLQALLFDRVRTAGEGSVFAFDEIVHLEDLELTSSDGDSEQIARGLVEFRSKVEETNEIDELLDGLLQDDANFAHFCATSLRAGHFSYDKIADPLRKKLSSDEWRFAVFHKLDEPALESVLLFLSEWHLQQEDDWVVRVPHILAYECENATTEHRTEFLFACTLWQCLAVDIASPIVRLLVGPKREVLIAKMRIWREVLIDISMSSEPWVAARVRGLLGSIGRFL